MKRVFGILCLIAAITGCKDDDESTPPIVPEEPATKVVFDLNEVPYEKLSDYQFFDGEMSNQEPVDRVIPYDVITPLFSDYAHKFRFLWMPEDVSASYNGDHDILAFQDGTVMIKTFYFDNVQPDDSRRILETRLEFMRNGQWEFAEYIWNEEQTEAYLDMDGSIIPITWKDDSNELHDVMWRAPSEAECLTCHKSDDMAFPIGPKPQNINKDFDYKEGVKNQLVKWEEMGYLESGYPGSINTVVPWDDPNYELEERVRAYLDMNCSHCHRDNSHCDYRPIRLAWDETEDLTNLGVCVEPDDIITPGQTHIINSGRPDRSMLYYRLNTNLENERMPLLGRTVKHDEALELIFDYITSLEDPC